MTERSHDSEVETLQAEIAGLREEIAKLAAGAKKSAGIHAGQAHAAAGQEGPTNGEEGHGAWADLVHNVNSSRIQSVKVARDLAAEVEHHPLLSIMAAFGLGYLIAKLWYRENRQ